MKSKALLILCFFLLMMSFSINSASAYVNEGRGDEGTQVLVLEGKIGNETMDVFMITQLANNSAAKQWEVNLIVRPANPDLIYVVDIRDNHLELDPDYDTDSVLEPDERENIGYKKFGPYLVWASANENWGDLIWEINILNRDGDQSFVSFIMRWGYGIDPPDGILRDGEIDDGENTTRDEGVPPSTILTTTIAGILGPRLAYKRATNDRLDPENADMRIKPNDFIRREFDE